MTNPFASAAPAPAAPAPAPTAVATAPPMFVAPAPAPAAQPAPAAPAPAEAPKNLGVGDPFAAPKGIGDGERITDFVGRLLLIRPTEFIENMGTTQGPSDAVRVDMAVLDDPVDPGKIVLGVLVFQKALRRETKRILDDRKVPYLLGRLNKGKLANGNDLYTFLEATPEEQNIARSWLKLGGEL